MFLRSKKQTARVGRESGLAARSEAKRVREGRPVLFGEPGVALVVGLGGRRDEKRENRERVLAAAGGVVVERPREEDHRGAFAGGGV